MNDLGIINSQWMSRVKEVFDWIISLNTYCILNIHHDGKSENCLSKGLKTEGEYANL